MILFLGQFSAPIRISTKVSEIVKIAAAIPSLETPDKISVNVIDESIMPEMAFASSG